MNQNEFRNEVKRHLEIEENDQADEIIAAVLGTLSLRISAEEAEHLAAQLPEPYETYVRREGDIETFSVDEYFERIAGQQRVDVLTASRYARVVINVLTDAVTRGEIADIKAQLPATYDILFSQEEAT